MSKWFFKVVGLAVLVYCTASCLTTVVYAQTLQSPSYKFEESNLGGGGSIQSNSANFQSRSSISDTAVGNSASTNFQTEAGSTTTNDPALTFIINTGSINFGSFSASTATV